MGQIKILPNKDFVHYAKTMINAFPGFPGYESPDKPSIDKLSKILKKMDKDDSTLNYFGYYENKIFLGGIRFFDFTMNLFGNSVINGGGSLLGVDLMHKKERIAKQLMEFFLDYYLKKKATIISLYPFRPDFYHKMGFGYGAKRNDYIIKPLELPDKGDKSKVRFYEKKDWAKLKACYNRYAKKRHGMYQKVTAERRRYDADSVRIALYEQKGKVLGYVAFTFKTSPDESFLKIQIKVSEFIYETREAFLGLISFLRSQGDQAKYIIMPSPDDNLHFLPFDPRNHTDRLLSVLAHETNIQGVGVMYRIIDTPGFFKILKNHNFNNQTCRMKISINDSFLKSNNKSFIVSFDNGKAKVNKTDNAEVEIKLNVAEFSSMVLGVVDFKTLYNYGLAEISNTKYIEIVNSTFLTESKPITTTDF
ncbi:MAG: GNAT family N-acetyltransferase [candidate division Zixibacteria bacterium]|nr:GNAT family N-acetyltransferase [candidate division Zixibacteria bacterium]